MYRLFIVFIIVVRSITAFGQSTNINDPEAGTILDKTAAKYRSYNGMEVDFTLSAIRPKLKPEDADSKYTDTDNGKLYMKGDKFKIVLNGYELYCDGKTTYNYSSKAKEVQINDYEESAENLSPTRIFKLYKDGYSYQIKEKKPFQGKNVTVVELAPANHKVSYFKIDIAIEDATYIIMEAKVYEKSGTRYVYKINKVTTEEALSDASFVFDSQKHAGVKLVDLR